MRNDLQQDWADMYLCVIFDKSKTLAIFGAYSIDPYSSHGKQWLPGDLLNHPLL